MARSIENAFRLADAEWALVPVLHVAGRSHIGFNRQFRSVRSTFKLTRRWTWTRTSKILLESGAGSATEDSVNLSEVAARSDT
jgi:hypothetical protein